MRNIMDKAIQCVCIIWVATVSICLGISLVDMSIGVPLTCLVLTIGMAVILIMLGLLMFIDEKEWVYSIVRKGPNKGSFFWARFTPHVMK